MGGESMAQGGSRALEQREMSISSPPQSRPQHAVGPGGKQQSIAVLLLKESIMYALMFGSVVLSAKILGNILDPYKEQKKAAKRRLDILQKALGGVNLQLDEFEMVMASNVVNPMSIDNTLEDVLGWGNIIRELENEVLKPLSHPAIFRSSMYRPAKGVLLYGPPGTGKTMLAKGLARRSNCYFINVTASSILSKWLGDANRLVRATFTLAQKLQPCILFIDEVDSLLGSRKESDHEAIVAVKTEFMQLWDGIETGSDSCILVLGATNRPWMVDEAILRRFTLQYELGLPDDSQRQEILLGYLRKHQRELRNQHQVTLRRIEKAQQRSSKIPKPAPARPQRGSNGGEFVDVDTLEIMEAEEQLGGRQRRNSGSASASSSSRPEMNAIVPELLTPGSSALQHLVTQTKGFSGSDLAELCRTACRLPLTEALSAGLPAPAPQDEEQVESQLAADLKLLQQLRPVNRDDFQAALERSRPSGERAGQYYRHMGGGPSGEDARAPDDQEAAALMAQMLAMMASRGRGR